MDASHVRTRVDADQFTFAKDERPRCIIHEGEKIDESAFRTLIRAAAALNQSSVR